MYNKFGFLALLLSLELFVRQTGAWYLGVGHLPPCAYNCLNRVISEQYACQDLKCFCQNHQLVTSSEVCFRKECDFNSLSKAFKLMATCQESYGSTAPPPPSSSSPAAPATPSVANPSNPYVPVGSTPYIYYPYNGAQFNGASQPFTPQPQPFTAGLPPASQPQAPAAQIQAPAAGGSSASQLQAPTTGMPQNQAQAPAGGQTHGPEAGSHEYQLMPAKGGVDNSTTNSTPQTKNTAPLFGSMGNSSANPSSGPPFSAAGAASGLCKNSITSSLLTVVVLYFLAV